MHPKSLNFLSFEKPLLFFWSPLRGGVRGDRPQQARGGAELGNGPRGWGAPPSADHTRASVGYPKTGRPFASLPLGGSRRLVNKGWLGYYTIHWETGLFHGKLDYSLARMFNFLNVFDTVHGREGCLHGGLLWEPRRRRGGTLKYSPADWDIPWLDNC